MRGKLLISLNITPSPIANKYHERRLKKPLKRELNSTWHFLVVNRRVQVQVQVGVARVCMRPAKAFSRFYLTMQLLRHASRVHFPRSLQQELFGAHQRPGVKLMVLIVGCSIRRCFIIPNRAHIVRNTQSINVGTQKMVNYAWPGWSQGKPWWRTIAILMSKSIVMQTQATPTWTGPGNRETFLETFQTFWA